MVQPTGASGAPCVRIVAASVEFLELRGDMARDEKILRNIQDQDAREDAWSRRQIGERIVPGDRGLS